MTGGDIAGLIAAGVFAVLVCLLAVPLITLGGVLDELRAGIRESVQSLTPTLAETQEANRRLQDILRAAQREKFGKRSEKLSPDQFNLPLEDAEFAQGVLEAAQEKAEAAMQRARGEPPRKPKRNRGHLPSHLPRIERVIEPASTLCPCGCGEMARIGEDVSERLDVIPAQFRVLVTRRPKYACRSCTGGVTQGPTPPWLIEGGLPTEGAIAHVPVSKYADHLPLYRQSQILARSGIDIHRSTLADRVGVAAFHLRPVVDRLAEHLETSTKLFMPSRQIALQSPAG